MIPKWVPLDEAFEKLLNYNRTMTEMFLNFAAWTTETLSHTPIEIWEGSGFKYVYGYVSFLALVSIICIWAYAAVRVSWGFGSWSDFGEVVSRTAVALIIINLAPPAMVMLAGFANKLSGAFAVDYAGSQTSESITSASESAFIVFFFAAALAFYVTKLLFQYAWRIGAITLAYSFLPLFSVLWIIPSQKYILPKVYRSVIGLFIIQIAQTVEMWVFTWVTFGASETSVFIKLLMQLGMLQVMVSTPSYITRHMEGWSFVDNPERAFSDVRRAINGHPLGRVFHRVKRAWGR